jgi:AcrR family transcriptional regulator
MVTTTRKTAEERREAVLGAAFEEFAKHGFEGASTDSIARKAGISQPYLFRLFGTKKELFIASSQRCFAETLALFRSAAEGKSGEEAWQAIGRAYMEMITAEPNRLRGQLQAYAASDDPEIRDVVRRGYGQLVDYVQRIAGLEPEALAAFFAKGMLMNVIVALDLFGLDEPWARQLLEGCGKVVG